MSTDDTGTVITVNGRIDPIELGTTLPHEHVFADWGPDKYSPPTSAVDRQIAEQSLSLENRWYVRQDPSGHRDNLALDSFDEMVDELGRYRRAGGDSIVDVTPKNVGGDPKRVRAVARETGVRIVHGTAFYTRSSHPDRIDGMTVDEIADEFVADIRHGIDDTDVRAGIVGEIGCTDFIHEQERKVLRAGARAALRTGAPVSVHPPFQRTEEWPTSRRALMVLDVVEEEGLPPERLVLCHRDQSKWLEQDLQYQREIAERGAYVEFDLFGHDDLYYAEQNDAQPSDLDRVKFVTELVEDGYEDRLLLSQDNFLKQFLTKYGGYGYAHILENIVPLLHEFGVGKEAVETMLVENPRHVLTFIGPEE